MQVVRSRQRPVELHTRGLYPVGCQLLQENSGHHGSPSGYGLEECVEKSALGLDVVVEHDEDLCPRHQGGTIDRSAEAEVRFHRHDPRGRL
ncbi:MAG TPA: hypothetical protein VGR11_10160 [Solirubrobacteraceae bacterium]|nr:hypothetical protein [Solirubrobacteraceae bacterium]